MKVLHCNSLRFGNPFKDRRLDLVELSDIGNLSIDGATFLGQSNVFHTTSLLEFWDSRSVSQRALKLIFPPI